MNDAFAHYSPSLDGPAAHGSVVVPNDSADLATASRALWIGEGGNLSVTLVGGETLTFIGLTAGWHPLRVIRIHATGTTAGSMIAVW